MVYYQTVLLAAAVILTSTTPSFGQGKSADRRSDRSATSRVEEAQQRVQSRANQRADQQLQRRTTELGRRLGQRNAEERRRAASSNAGRKRVETIAGSAAKQRGLEKAIQHADLHSAIAKGLSTGKPIRLTEKQREVVSDVFGDPSLIEGDRSAPQSQVEPADVYGKNMLPGSKANPRARLANAIRVRQTKISELRDLAIETNDESLLEKADFFEAKLQKFVENQARVEASLAKAATRARSIETEPIANDPLIEDDTVVRTADADSAVTTDTESETVVETRIE